MNWLSEQTHDYIYKSPSFVSIDTLIIYRMAQNLNFDEWAYGKF